MTQALAHPIEQGVVQPILINAGPSGMGWSSLETFQLCERKFYHLRVRGREAAIHAPDLAAKDPVPLSFPLIRGSLAHVGLAHEYSRRAVARQGGNPEIYFPRDKAMELTAVELGGFYGLNGAVEMWNGGSTTVGEILEDVAKPLVNGYFNYWDAARENLPVVAVEHLVEASLDGGHGISQRLDLVYYDAASGTYFITDHKTSSETNIETLKARYSLSGQFLLMQLFGRAIYGARFGGVRVNVLGTRYKPDKDGSIYFFKRFSPEASPSALAEFPMVAAEIRKRIEAKRGQPMSAYQPAFHEQICRNSYEGRCIFYKTCQWGDDA